MQTFAADFVGDALGFKYGPGEGRKSEATILGEQKAAIIRLENDTSRRKETIDVWRRTQIKAANILRTCLGEKPLNLSGETSSLNILEIQRAAIAEMEEQRKLLINVLPAGRGKGEMDRHANQ